MTQDKQGKKACEVIIWLIGSHDSSSFCSHPDWISLSQLLTLNKFSVDPVKRHCLMDYTHARRPFLSDAFPLFKTKAPHEVSFGTGQ
jgi:hypothetical protein